MTITQAIGTILVTALILYSFSDPYDLKKPEIKVRKPISKKFKPKQFIKVTDDQLN
jgi:hypothetical protein